MTAIQVLPWLLAVCVGLAFWYVEKRKPREMRYRIKLKFAHGIKTRLTLNETQYEQFTAWLNSPDGIFVLGEDTERIWLDRQYVVSVEMRKR